MKAAKQLLVSLLSAFFLLTFTLTSSSEAYIGYMFLDCEDWQDTTDSIMNVALTETTDVMTYDIDKSGVLQGQNSVRISYDLKINPRYAGMLLYPDDEGCKAGQMDGYKLSLRSDTPLTLLVRITCDWVGASMFVEVGPEAKEYTIRMDDLVFDNPDFDYKTAYCVNCIAIQIFSDEGLAQYQQAQPEGFTGAGTIWVDDVYFFMGEDVTDLSGKALQSSAGFEQNSTEVSQSSTEKTKTTQKFDAEPEVPANNKVLWLSLGGVGVVVAIAVVAWLVIRKKKK